MLNTAEELIIVLDQIKRGSIYIRLKDGTKIHGKLVDTTPGSIIVNARFLHKGVDQLKIYDLGRIEVAKHHIERWLVAYDGGKK